MKKEKEIESCPTAKIEDEDNVILEWKCNECGAINTSDKREHHTPDFCKCGRSMVDAEMDYIRVLGDVEYL